MYRQVTPNAPGAVAIVEITGDVNHVLERAGIAPVSVGQVAHRDLLGVDHGLVIRWSDECCHCTPHAGPAIVRQICDELERLGVVPAASPDLRRAWPEASDVHEARMLEALARVRSPRAIDLLFDQPARWRAEAAGVSRWTDAEIAVHASALNRLLEPPLVVAIGGPNIGKSTLLNAIAQAQVSVVADEPGVTRDHVGATLIVDGLAVRWIDTPGLRENAGRVERDAAELAVATAARADLLLLCSTADVPCPIPSGLEQTPSLLVGLQADRGTAQGSDVLTAAGADGQGVEALGQAIRRRLVPDASLEWPGPWRLPGARGKADARD